MGERAPAKDDALLCVDRMQPAFREIINHGFRGETLLCAMATTFGELLSASGRSDVPLNRARAASALLPAVVHDELPDCQSQIKAMIATAKEERFTPDAILASMLGALVNLYRAFRFSEQDIAEVTETMTAWINEAPRISVN